MKVRGNGQAKILAKKELEKLFDKGLPSERDKALFAILYYTGCRVSEALALTCKDVQDGIVTFRKSTTKGVMD